MGVNVLQWWSRWHLFCILENRNCCLFLPDATLNCSVWARLRYFLRLTAFFRVACFLWPLRVAFLGHLFAFGPAAIVCWALRSKPLVNQSARCSLDWVGYWASHACAIRSCRLFLLQIRAESKKEGLVLQWCSLHKAPSCLSRPLVNRLDGQCSLSLSVLNLSGLSCFIFAAMSVKKCYFFRGLSSEWVD